VADRLVVRLRLIPVAIGLLLLWKAARVQGVLFYATADPDYNTTAPTGLLSGSGWDLEGFWGGFLGTPIASYYFLTARHVGGSTGDPFVLNGITYTTTGYFDDPSSDLRIWQVNSPFPSYAPIYTNKNEAGNGLVVIGRGTQRGAAVTLQDLSTQSLSSSTPQVKGWLWGPADGRKRWGENTVHEIANGDAMNQSNGGPASPIGDLLEAWFQSDGGPNEADLSVGDSGGGVFIREGTTWKLAGINYAVDGPFNLTNSGAGFEAAIFDQGGLYTQEGTNWVLTPTSPNPQPAAFYATRVSVHAAWIQTILMQPLPPVLQSAASPSGPYLDDPAARVESSVGTIAIPLPSVPHFYRLRSTVSSQITFVQVNGTQLVLGYEQTP
jgi:hypothetical protein